jgi:hypothetical protein
MTKNLDVIPNACEIVSYIIQCSELPKLPNTVTFLFQKLVNLYPIYETAIQSTLFFFKREHETETKRTTNAELIDDSDM